jgi:hypothetical protein
VKFNWRQQAQCLLERAKYVGWRCQCHGCVDDLLVYNKTLILRVACIMDVMNEYLSRDQVRQKWPKFRLISLL